MQRVKYKDGISIIVTLYNKEEYILQTLNSATNQFEESQKYQVIVVDDGSKDRSYKIAKDFLRKKKLITKFLLKEIPDQVSRQIMLLSLSSILISNF